MHAPFGRATKSATTAVAVDAPKIVNSRFKDIGRREGWRLHETKEFQLDNHKALATYNIMTAFADSMAMLSNNVRNAEHLAEIIVHRKGNRRARSRTEQHRRSLCHITIHISPIDKFMCERHIPSHKIARPCNTPTEPRDSF